MGIDEVLEVASRLAGRNVVIICSDGTELRGKLLRVAEDDFQMELEIGARTAYLPLGDVNWLSQA